MPILHTKVCLQVLRSTFAFMIEVAFCGSKGTKEYESNKCPHVKKNLWVCERSDLTSVLDASDSRLHEPLVAQHIHQTVSSQVTLCVT